MASGLSRRCQEYPCQETIPADARADAKTCSTSCRAKRSRRLAKARKKGGENHIPEHHQEMNKLISGALPDEARNAIQDELRPVVREAMTADVMTAISSMIKLTPRMVELIELDLESTDPVIRQRAYTLLMKYTVGNTAVAPMAPEHSPAPMQVIFNVPRPGDGDLSVETSAIETRQCGECNVMKAETDFEGSSDRCTACHDRLQALVTDRFGEQH